MLHISHAACGHSFCTKGGPGAAEQHQGPCGSWNADLDPQQALPLQEEYAREGIDWSYVEFVDNQICLDLLEGAAGAPSLGVFPLIDEACRMPRATFQVRLRPAETAWQPDPWQACGNWSSSALSWSTPAGRLQLPPLCSCPW